MHEKLDYSLLGRTPALPDFCSNRGTTSPTHTETLWPSGRRQYTIGLNDSINMMFRAPENGDLWGVDATAETTKGTFHIQYDWSGHLHRVRVSLADMIIFGSMHANFAEKERQSAISRRNQYDAYVSVFPKDHVIRVQ